MKFSIVLLTLLATVGAGQDAVLITGAKVLAADGDRFLDDHAVLVRDGRIAAVARVDEIAREGARVVKLDGAWLVPGLIDLHSHLVLYPYDQRTWNDQVLKESTELRTIRAVTHAAATLRAGWTTLRDLGTEGAGFADVALRDAINRGIIPGPRVFAVTRALVATGCYGPSGFAPHVCVPKGAQVADGVVACRKAVREQIAAGADWIKVYADYRRKPGDPSTPTFSLDELRAIVDEARSARVKVASHAVTSEAIRRSVLAGVHTIEHGYQANAEVLRAMKARGVALCPTLAANEAICRYRGWRPGQPEPQRIVDARAMFRRALQAGVTIACGSDVGVFAHGDNARELELMVAYGMDPRSALKAATSVAARVIDQEDLGVIAAEAHADLVAFAGNPLADIAHCRKPVFVMKAGTVFTE